MIMASNYWLFRKKGGISLKQIAVIILALLVAAAFYYIIGGLRNEFLPK